MSDREQQIQALFDAGLHPVPLKPGEKDRIKGTGGNQTFGLDYFMVTQPNCNVGILPAMSDNVVDIDLDMAEASEFAPRYMFYGWNTPQFGRGGVLTHGLVRCRDMPTRKPAFDFKDVAKAKEKLGQDKKAGAIELKTGNVAIMVPPSLHPSGLQPLEWRTLPAVGLLEVSWEQLHFRTAFLAFWSVLIARSRRQFDGATQDRQMHAICMALAGWLVKIIDDDAIVDALVDDYRREFGSSEIGMNHARESRSQIEADQPCTGLNQLCELLDLEWAKADILRWFGLGKASEKKRFEPPQGSVQLGQTNLQKQAEEVAAVLVGSRLPIFRQGTALVHPEVLQTRLGDRDNGDIEFAKGTTILREAGPDWLAIKASAHGVFWKDGRNGAELVAPSQNELKDVIRICPELPFPVITGLSMVPTLDRSEPGYDPETGLFLAFPPGAFPPVPEAPGLEEARAALQVFLDLIKGFPFVTEQDLSVTLATFLMAVYRSQMRNAPLSAVTAPAARTGKSKLHEIAGIMSTGVIPPSGGWKVSEVENAKTLFAALRSAPTAMLIDNVSATMRSDFLCKVLTQEQMQDRVLGESRDEVVGTRCLMMANGNNLRFAGDLTQRVIISRLDAKMANPGDRKFDWDPVEEALKRRPELVVAALTILKAARSHAALSSPVNGFVDFCLIRGALTWLGLPDPMASRAEVQEDSDDLEEKAELFHVLCRYYPPDAPGFLMRDIDRMPDVVHPAMDLPGQERGTSGVVGNVKDDLRRLLKDQRWNKKACGELLARNKDVPFEGVVLRSKVDGTLRVAKYWLEKAE